jgi:hypothetical protein
LQAKKRTTDIKYLAAVHPELAEGQAISLQAWQLQGLAKWEKSP